jgi:hypothetical protein
MARRKTNPSSDKFYNDLAEEFYERMLDGDNGDDSVTNDISGEWAILYREERVILYSNSQGFVVAHKFGPQKLMSTWNDIVKDLEPDRDEENPRRRNQGRQYDDWVQFELDGIADQQDVEITPELREEAAKFESAVYEALDEWTRKHPPRDGSSVDDLFEEGDASWNVYATLVGHGVGIWDGRWDQYYSEKEIEQLTKFLEKRLGKFADVTGGGSLGYAFHEATYTAENPRRARRRRR